MLNNEEILIKVIELLDLNIKDVKLKAPIQKKRFIHRENKLKKYDEHINLIFEELQLDSVNEILLDIVYELMYIYDIAVQELSIHDNLDKGKKLDWIILKRLVIPFLAIRMANLDKNYNNRIDKNIAGGKFWYLPDLTIKNKIKMPVSNLVDWWLDLSGKKLDSFCEEMDEKIEYDLHSTSRPLNIFKSWIYKNKLPSRQSIINYCSLKMNYTGIFEGSTTDFTHKNFDKSVDFVQNTKHLTEEELIHEIPEMTLIKRIYNKKFNISLKDKKKFIKLIKERWSIPSKTKLISNFLVCRVSQKLYKNLIEYFEFKETNDIEENKILQLLYLYMYLYNGYIDDSFNELLGDKAEQVSFAIEYRDIMKYLETRDTNCIHSIIGDIRLEIENPDEKNTKYPNIFIVMMSKFLEEKQKYKALSLMSEYMKTTKYFLKSYARWEKSIQYISLDIETYKNMISKEENFMLLHEIFDKFINKNYLQTKMICSRMHEIASTDDEKEKYMYAKLTLYTALTYIENENNYLETKELLDKYESHLKKHSRFEKENKAFLSRKASFYFKAKDFSKSLDYFDEYVEKYLIGNKKDEFDLTMVYFAAYCAHEVKDKLTFNKFNNILERHQWPIFSSSTPFLFRKCYYK